MTECPRNTAASRRLALWAAAAVAALAGTALPVAVACSCPPTPPPCEAYWRSPMVFLGTVTGIPASPDRDGKRLRMRIDRVYKGVSEPALVLFDDGMCDGPDLRLGEQYLMYTRRDEEGKVPFRGCTRSRLVVYAEEDLKYLDSLGQLAPTASVFGQVMVETDGPGATIRSRERWLRSGDRIRHSRRSPTTKDITRSAAWNPRSTLSGQVIPIFARPPSTARAFRSECKPGAVRWSTRCCASAGRARSKGA